MKLSELKAGSLQEETKGKWKIGNLKGVYKNFKSNESPDARRWMTDRSLSGDKVVWNGSNWVIDQKVIDRENRKTQREQEREDKEQRDWDNRNNPTDKDLKMLYDRGIEAVGSSFPDGDPIDHMLPYLRKKDWGTDEIDQAFKKYGHGDEKKGFYAYVASVWDDFTSDTVADAKTDLKLGRTPDDNSPFFDIEDGKVVPRRNPWR